jgi:lipopolysaccharide transport system ATP-binding protein
MTVVISSKNLGKLYRLGEVGTGSLAHDVNRLWYRVRGKQDPYEKIGVANERTKATNNNWVWALRDVTFDVNQGEVLGIIGRNGAGKSTLLKILSRVTAPTQGEVRVWGRIASLLEVGTGFHPELSGRENIFLNGAILGMRKSEIERKLDEIVEFSGCRRYLDTPVKRYSSGMYVRLAFAVAAHLEPEILIVDEVLAVGDAEFQKKCLGKMKNASRSDGRTVLFVSHNLAAVRSLCTRVICIENGAVVADGRPDTVIQRYLHAQDGEAFDGQISPNRPRLYSTGELLFTRVSMRANDGSPASVAVTGDSLRFDVEFEVKTPIENIMFEVGLLNCEGTQVTQSRNPLHNAPGHTLERGRYRIELVSELTLFPGEYSVLLGAHYLDGTTIDWVERALDFEVLNAPVDSANHQQWQARGFIRPQDTWSAPIQLSFDSLATRDCVQM